MTLTNFQTGTGSFLSTDNGGGGMLTLPNSQPPVPGLWLNAGTLTFWDGLSNHVLDFNEGAQQSLFGTPLGDI